MTKRDLLQALASHGLGDLTEADVFIYRAGSMSRQPLCTVFVSFPNAPAVDTALTLLKGHNFNGLCKGPLKAEKATPRMSTFRQRTNEPLALADMSPVVRQNLEKEPTEGQHVMRHWLTVKKEEEHYKTRSGGSHGPEVLPVDSEPDTDQGQPLGEAPWKRRRRLRGEDK